MPNQDDGKFKGHVKGDSGRQERLAAELRANLRKRKEKARALNRQKEQGRPDRNTEN